MKPRIAAVIPTFKRPAALRTAIERIRTCLPGPDQILVHVDYGDKVTSEVLAKDFPDVVVLRSEQRRGPGGGRNQLIAASDAEIVASFDDDSYPLDGDYFSRLTTIFELLPDAAAIASHITDKGHEVPDARRDYGLTVHFGGGGVAYRRNAFLASGGYVSLPLAYGMEEVDLCLRLTDAGRKIYYSPWLRVYHDNDLSHHADPDITAGSIANIALLVFLRYPLRYWPYGMAQLVNRIRWLVKVGRIRGIGRGLARTPAHLWKHRGLRQPVSARGLRTFLRARRREVALQPLAI